MEWKRPENIPYPMVWSKFEGSREINGKKPKFWIQDITEDMHETIVKKMLAAFVLEEPLCKFSKLAEDAVSLNEGIELYKQYVIPNKLSCVCLTDYPDGNPKLVGISCLEIVSKDDPEFQYTGKTRARLDNLVKYAYSLNDPFTHFGINKYLSDRGIYVFPEYRGQGICLEFLKSWSIICKATGLKVVVGTFTSKFSQRSADRAGFGELLSIPYADLEKVNPEFSLPGIQEHTKNLRILYVEV